MEILHRRHVYKRFSRRSLEVFTAETVFSESKTCGSSKPGPECVHEVSAVAMAMPELHAARFVFEERHQDDI
jgi:hypothetical protein